MQHRICPNLAVFCDLVRYNGVMEEYEDYEEFETLEQKPPFNRREHLKRIGFKPGISGNPAGKKKGTKNMIYRWIAEAASNEKLVDHNGKPMTPQERIAKAILRKAMKGDLRAMKYLVDVY